jgi:hypothetical protein
MIHVELLDHIILGAGQYLSFKEKGLLDNMPKLSTIFTENKNYTYSIKERIEVNKGKNKSLNCTVKYNKLKHNAMDR